MKIITRNINGIRACVKKGFGHIVMHELPDILCLQEIKAYQNQIPPEIPFIFKDYNFVYNPAEKPGYAGTAIFYRKDIQIISYNTFGETDLFAKDGRIIEMRFYHNGQLFVLLNLYFPNGNSKTDGTKMLPDKLLFYDKFLEHINNLKNKGLHIVCGGDFNVAHKEIDLTSPKQNKHSIGFLIQEREKIDQLIADGFTDVFRHYNPDKPNQYTRWSYRKGMKEANKGRRYDYFFVNSKVLPYIQKISHLSQINASDHCPIRLILK